MNNLYLLLALATGVPLMLATILVGPLSAGPLVRVSVTRVAGVVLFATAITLMRWQS